MERGIGSNVGRGPEAEVDCARLASRLALMSAAVAWLACALWLLASLRANDGRLVYTLDDSYIQLAMARNLAVWGTYGLEPGVVTSASSSPAWVGLMALLCSVLPSAAFEAAPFLINLLAGTAALVLLVRAAARRWPGATTRWQARCAYAAAAFLPLLVYVPGLASIGMEHGPHLLLTLAFVLTFAGGPTRRQVLRLALLAAVLPLVRPEALFLIGVASLLWLLQGRRREALLLVLAAGLPMALLGLITGLPGDTWLPRSVLLKTVVTPLPGQTFEGYLARVVKVFLERWSFNLSSDGGVLALAISVVALLAFQAGRGRSDRPPGLVAACFLGTLTAQAVFARLEHFGRYQAYLNALGLLAFLLLAGPALLEPLAAGRRTVRLLVVAALALPLVFYRQFGYQALAWKASNNIYRQQYQMGRFLRTAYPHDPVAVNDIGTVSYLRPGPLLDLAGLASKEVGDLMWAGRYDAAAVDRLTRDRGVRVAVIYDRWFPLEGPGGITNRPAHWRRVATWTLQGLSVTPADKTVSFYAPGGPEEAERLGRALREFEPLLPRGVLVRYDASAPARD